MALNAPQVLDAYFPELRAKLLDVAATLDRLDRATDLHAVRGDPRVLFVHDALAILQSTAPNRAELLLNRYSL